MAGQDVVITVRGKADTAALKRVEEAVQRLGPAVSKGLAAGAAGAETLEKAIGKVGGGVKAAGAHFADFQKKGESAFNKVAAKAAQHWKTFALGAAGAFAAVGVGLVKLGASFDEAYAKIRVGTGATGAALRSLEADFRAVAGGVAIGFGDSAQIVADLNTRLGLTGEQLRTVATQMGQLKQMGVEASVENVTRVFGDWSVATDKQSGALDYLFKVSQATGPSVDRIGQLMVQYGAPLRQMGFSYEQAAAMMGKFEKEGVNTELVMGSLRIGLVQMARAGEAPAETFGRVVENIKNAGSAAEANLTSMQIFGARAGPDMAAAIREGRFELDSLMQSLEASDETIGKAAEESMTLGQSFALFRNQVALAFAPAAAPLIDMLKEGMARLREILADPAIQQNLANIGAIAGEVVARGIDMFVGAVANARTWLGDLVGFIQANAPLAATLLGLIGITVLSVVIPALWSMAVSGVGAVASFVAFLLFGGVTSIATFAGSILMTAIPAVATFATTLLTQGVGAAVSYAASLVGSMLPANAQVALSFGTQLIGGIVGFATSIVTTAIPAAAAFAVALVTQTIPGVAASANAFLSTLIPAIGAAAVAFLTQTVPSAAAAGASFIVSTVPGAIAAAVTFIGTLIPAIIATAGTFIAGLIPALIAVGAGFLSMLATALVALFGLLAAAVSAVIGIIIAFAPLILAVVAIGAVIYLLYKAWTNNWFGIQKATGKAVDWIRNALAKGWQMVVKGVSAAFGFIGKIAKGGLAILGDLWGKALGWLKEKAATAFVGIANGIKAVFNKVLSFIRGAFSRILDLFRALIAALPAPIRDTIGMMVSGLGSGVDKVTESVNGLREAFGSAREEGGGLSGILTSIMGKLGIEMPALDALGGGEGGVPTPEQLMEQYGIGGQPDISSLLNQGGGGGATAKGPMQVGDRGTDSLGDYYIDEKGKKVYTSGAGLARQQAAGSKEPKGSAAKAGAKGTAASAAETMADVAVKVAEAIKTGLDALRELAGADIPDKSEWEPPLFAVAEFITASIERFDKIAVDLLDRAGKMNKEGVLALDTGRAQAIETVTTISGGMMDVMSKTTALLEQWRTARWPTEEQIDEAFDKTMAVVDRIYAKAVELSASFADNRTSKEGESPAQTFSAVGSGMSSWADAFAKIATSAVQLGENAAVLAKAPEGLAVAERAFDWLAATSGRLVRGLMDAIPEEDRELVLELSKLTADTFGAWSQALGNIVNVALGLVNMPIIPRRAYERLSELLANIALISGTIVDGLRRGIKKAQERDDALALSKAVADTFAAWIPVVSGIATVAATGLDSMPFVSAADVERFRKLLENLASISGEFVLGMRRAFPTPAEQAETLALSRDVGATFRAWGEAMVAIVDAATKIGSIPNVPSHVIERVRRFLLDLAGLTGSLVRGEGYDLTKDIPAELARQGLYRDVLSTITAAGKALADVVAAAATIANIGTVSDSAINSATDIVRRVFFALIRLMRVIFAPGAGSGGFGFSAVGGWPKVSDAQAASIDAMGSLAAAIKAAVDIVGNVAKVAESFATVADVSDAKIELAADVARRLFVTMIRLVRTLFGDTSGGPLGAGFTAKGGDWRVDEELVALVGILGTFANGVKAATEAASEVSGVSESFNKAGRVTDQALANLASIAGRIVARFATIADEWANGRTAEQLDAATKQIEAFASAISDSVGALVAVADSIETMAMAPLADVSLAVRRLSSIGSLVVAEMFAAYDELEGMMSRAMTDASSGVSLLTGGLAATSGAMTEAEQSGKIASQKGVESAQSLRTTMVQGAKQMAEAVSAGAKALSDMLGMVAELTASPFFVDPRQSAFAIRYDETYVETLRQRIVAAIRAAVKALADALNDSEVRAALNSIDRTIVEKLAFLAEAYEKVAEVLKNLDGVTVPENLDAIIDAARGMAAALGGSAGNVGVSLGGAFADLGTGAPVRPATFPRPGAPSTGSAGEAEPFGRAATDSPRTFTINLDLENVVELDGEQLGAAVEKRLVRRGFVIGAAPVGS